MSIFLFVVVYFNATRKKYPSQTLSSHWKVGNFLKKFTFLFFPFFFVRFTIISPPFHSVFICGKINGGWFSVIVVFVIAADCCCFGYYGSQKENHTNKPQFTQILKTTAKRWKEVVGKEKCRWQGIWGKIKIIPLLEKGKYFFFLVAGNFYFNANVFFSGRSANYVGKVIRIMMGYSSHCNMF